MKSVAIAGIGAVLAIVVVPFVGEISGITSRWLHNSAIAQNTKALKLYLTGEKQVLDKSKVTWEPLLGKAAVQPKDVLRYTLIAENQSDRQLKNIVINQAIPAGTVYILKSIHVSKPAKITYSLDRGRTFVENPTVSVTQPDGKVVTQPAPAVSYTFIRLQIPVITAREKVKATYETNVR